ncbi:hypothetical protein BC940DRAFT_15151 [Gongronella butleri]|nr:hypothetical protein BC940DRAFT_15151 [Gongronella butleri]
MHWRLFLPFFFMKPGRAHDIPHQETKDASAYIRANNQRSEFIHECRAKDTTIAHTSPNAGDNTSKRVTEATGTTTTATKRPFPPRRVSDTQLARAPVHSPSFYPAAAHHTKKHDLDATGSLFLSSFLIF